MSKARRQSNEELEARLAALETVGVKKVQNLTHTANGSTLLNSQTIQFNPANVLSVGDNILTLNNSLVANTSVFVANVKCKVDFAAAMHIDDNGNSASAGVHVFKNGNLIMVGTRTTDEVRGQCCVPVILEPGDRIHCGLPIGIVVSGQPVLVSIVAERIYTAAELEALS